VTSVVPRNNESEAGFDLVHANLLCSFPELVRELGGSPEAMLSRLGLRADITTKPESGLSYRAWVTLLEHAAAELCCTDFGLRLARLQNGVGVLGPMGTVMKNCNTFGEAIEYMASNIHAHSLAAGMHLVRDRDEQSLFVGHEILLDHLPNRRQAIEQVMLLGHLNALAITGGRARAREVHFRHQPLSSQGTYRAYFGSTMRFDETEDGVVFYERDLRSPIVHPDATLYSMARSYIDSRFTRITPPLHTQVRALVVRLIESGQCNNERICEALGLHPRTLHRRLKAEGKAFESIKDDVRRDVALRYLQETDHSLTFIAEKLGYAEQSVLTRSCLRWFSTSPSQLRMRAVH
jgi:AraC-like DNA-binding protein